MAGGNVGIDSNGTIEKRTVFRNVIQLYICSNGEVINFLTSDLYMANVSFSIYNSRTVLTTSHKSRSKLFNQ